MSDEAKFAICFLFCTMILGSVYFIADACKSERLSPLEKKAEAYAACMHTADSTVTICIGEGKTKQELVEITGRSVHTLQYTFYEGTVNMTQKDGTVKTFIRSVRKYESMEDPLRK